MFSINQSIYFVTHKLS